MTDKYDRQTNHGPLPEPAPSASSDSYKRTVIEFVFLVFAIAPIIHYGDNPALRNFSLTFSAIILEAMPFLLLGSLVGGLIEVLVPREKLMAWFGEQKWYTLFLAAGLGFVFPICECAIIPVMKRLLSKGISFSAAVAFLLGGPIVNPITFGSTAVAYSMILDIAVVRLVLGYVIAVFVGFAAGRLIDRDRAVHESVGVFHEEVGFSGSVYPDKSHDRRQPGLIDALTHGAEDFLDMFRYLVFGAFAAALIQNLIDRSFFVSLSGNAPLSIILMMALAALMSLCSEADAFVAASFQFSLPLSAQMAFMVLGPMFDIKLLFMALGVFRRNPVLVIYGFVIFTVFTVMILFHSFMVWILP
jgi:hypothetical protein